MSQRTTMLGLPGVRFPLEREAGGDGRTPHLDRLRGVVKQEGGVRHQQVGVELKRELVGSFGPELAGGLSLRDELCELVGPVALEPGNAFPDQSGVCVELGGSGSEEAAAGKARRSRWERNCSQSTSIFASGVVASLAGATTSASKISPAVSIVASWSSSLEPKWA